MLPSLGVVFGLLSGYHSMQPTVSRGVRAAKNALVYLSSTAGLALRQVSSVLEHYNWSQVQQSP